MGNLVFDNSFIDELKNVDESNKISLEGIFNRFIYIHPSIILEEDSAVTLLYIYIKVNRPWYEESCSGIAGTEHDCFMNISLKDAGSWYAPKSAERGEDGIVGQFRKALLRLDEMGFIELNNKDVKNKVYGRKNFEIKSIRSDNLNELDSRNNKVSYSKIYLDEIKRLLEIKKNQEDYGFKKLNIGNLFRIFLYLRMNIRLRVGKYKDYKPIERPEVYYEFYYNIVKKLNIDRGTFKKYVDILCEAKMLYKKHMRLLIEEHENKEDNRYETIRTVFCNPYVRIDNKVYRGGEKYCEDEVDRGFCKVIEEYKKNKRPCLKLNKSEFTLWKDDKRIENMKIIEVDRNIGDMFDLEDIT